MRPASKHRADTIQLRSRTASICCAVLFVAACDCGGGTGADSALEVAPETIDFGEVAVGLAGRRSLIVSNKGAGLLTILEAKVNAPLAPEVRVDAVPRGIAPGDSREIPIVFSPMTAGGREGELIIKTDSTSTPERRVRLLGLGIDPRIRVSPELIDFGRVVLGTVRTATVTIENVGTRRVVVRAVTADVETSEEFSAVLRGIRGLEPGESFNVAIAYQPNGPGFDEGRFIVADDTPLPVRVNVVVRGEGASSELGVEPRRIDFEGVFVGETRTRFFELKNLGAVTHTISSMSLLSTSTISELSIVSSTTTETPFSIDPGEVRRVEVAYTPVDDRDDTAEIVIESPALTGYELVSLTGRATRSPFALLQPSPAVLSFGPAEVGTAMLRRLRLANLGNTDIVLRAPLRISPPTAPYTLLEIPAEDARFAPRDDHALFVRFAPTEAGVAAPAAVVIETGDVDMPRIEVPLEGTGVLEPVRDLELDTADFELGHVPRGREALRALVLRSTGSATVTVSAATLLDDAGGLFRLDPSQFWPRSIAPGDALRLAILFRDGFGLSGPHAGRLELSTDDTDQPRVSIALSAATVEPIPSDADLVVRVTQGASPDVELHLLRPGGVLFDRPSDACWCAPNPDWGRLGEFGDDPFYGGDSIELQRMEPGLYSLAVVRREDGIGAAVVEISVYSRGTQAGVLSREVGPGLRWDVGTLELAGSGLVFDPPMLPLTRPLRDDCF